MNSHLNKKDGIGLLKVVNDVNRIQWKGDVQGAGLKELLCSLY